MMRLQRIGRRNEAHFKLVVIEKSKGPTSQKYVDIVGSYNPKAGQVILDTAKVQDWIAKGVQPSDTVFNMLISEGIVEGRKKNVLPKKSPTKKRNAPDEPEAKAETPAPAVATEETPAEEIAETTEAPAEAAAPVEETSTEAEAPVDEPSESVETPSEEKLEEAAEGTPETPATKEKTEA